MVFYDNKNIIWKIEQKCLPSSSQINKFWYTNMKEYFLVIPNLTYRCTQQHNSTTGLDIFSPRPDRWYIS